VCSNLFFLDKLYTLYSDVIMAVKRYEDTLWAELDFEKISTQLGDYQTKCRALPKVGRDVRCARGRRKTTFSRSRRRWVGCPFAVLGTLSFWLW